MKKAVLISIALISTLCSKAQMQVTFPFQGGEPVMVAFFKDSVMVSPEIISKRATGTVIIKFSADEKGVVKQLMIYYADDYILTLPIIAALKKSNHKWIIPDHDKTHDFVLPFLIKFNLPAVPGKTLPKRMFDFYNQRKPITAGNQIPLDNVTLLPTIIINYNIPVTK